MKTEINSQSQNEVKDLLNEYVVSPLNTDISAILNRIENEIEVLKEGTKSAFQEVSSSVNTNINRLKKQLDTSFHFSDEEDVFEKLSEAVEGSQSEIIDKIETTQKEIADSKEKLYSELIKNKTELISNVAGHFNQLNIFLQNLESASQTSIKDIKDELSKLELLFCNELEALTTLVTESFEKSDNAIEDVCKSMLSQLHNTDELIEMKFDELSKRLSSITQSISDDFENYNTLLNNYHEETNTTIHAIESQQKESKRKII